MIHWVKTGRQLSMQLTQTENYVLKKHLWVSGPIHTYFTLNSSRPATLTAFQNKITKEYVFPKWLLNSKTEVNTDI